VTKAELAQLVRLVYASFNRDLLPSEEKVIFAAWWALLQDLPEKETRKELTTLCTLQKYMPNPGALRRQYFKTRIKNPPPTSQQMWSYLQDLIRSKHSGVPLKLPKEISEHECVQNTMSELGASAYSMNTNGDRQFVLEAYQRHVESWQETAFSVTVVERNDSDDET
jgi:hypothetical protein